MPTILRGMRLLQLEQLKGLKKVVIREQLMPGQLIRERLTTGVLMRERLMIVGDLLEEGLEEEEEDYKENNHGHGVLQNHKLYYFVELNMSLLVKPQ